MSYHSVNSRMSSGGDPQYVAMLLQFGESSLVENVFAAIFTWMIYAGFITFPAALSSLVKMQGAPHVVEVVLHSVLNLPLYVQFHSSPFFCPPV
jgi:hypothetical protein